MSAFCTELLEGLPTAVLVSTATREIVFANEAAARLLGYEPQQLVGKPTDVLVPLRFREQHVGTLVEYWASQAQERRSRFCAVTQDGKELMLEASSTKRELSERGTVLISCLRSLSG